MKKILVLTDLSGNDSNLTKTAIVLAEKLRADIFLMNSYEGIPVTTFYGAGPWVGEDESWWEQESKSQLDKMAAGLRQVINKILPGEQWHPQVWTENIQGALVDNVKHVIAHHDIELVIMGGASESRFEHILFGNNTKSVITHALRPVIIIPAGMELNDIEKVFFATDYNPADVKAIHYLARLGKLLHFELEIVHVDVFGDRENAELEKKKEFLTLLEDLSYPELVHCQVHGKKIVSRLITLCKEKKVNLLGLIHQQDSLLVRMIRHSTASELLEKQALPLIIFPSKMT